jgi:hypothetical protein
VHSPAVAAGHVTAIPVRRSEFAHRTIAHLIWRFLFLLVAAEAASLGYTAHLWLKQSPPVTGSR